MNTIAEREVSKALLTKQQRAQIKAHILTFYTNRRFEKLAYKTAQRKLCDATRYMVNGMEQFHVCYHISDEAKRNEARAAWNALLPHHNIELCSRDHCRYVFALYAAARGKPVQDEHYGTWLSKLNAQELWERFEKSVAAR